MKVNVPGRDLTSQRSPRLTANDRGEGMRLTKVHDLNFRFTHGIAAKGKLLECQTCHDAEKFCTTCHEAGGNVNQGAFKPASHLLAGFTTLGVAAAAVSMHDLRNEILNRVQHVTVRKELIPYVLHVILMLMEERNWPEDHDPVLCRTTMVLAQWSGANCFLCHTDSNARPGGIKGQKFCGYCHR